MLQETNALDDLWQLQPMSANDSLMESQVHRGAQPSSTPTWNTAVCN